MDFTKTQLEAINHASGNLQLIACAGSGKTEVVARRVAELLRGGSITPANVVAFTFTEKAAAELKERIVLRCRDALGDVRGLAEMYVGTIHAFCLDLLKTEIHAFYKHDVLNGVQQDLFIDRHSKQSGLTATTTLDGKPLRRYVQTHLFAEALSVLRESDTVPAKLRGCSIVDGLSSYTKLLNERSYLDYSSILVEAVGALTYDQALRQRIAARIKHVIVDEYQDVNPIQERLVKTLSELGASICVVGDDDQTVYQWRGGDVSNILTFAKRYPSVRQVRLEENFRSSEGVVETARGFIEQNQERLEKRMVPTGAHPYEPGDLLALGFESDAAEAEWIAQTIKSLAGVAIKDGSQERGIALSDMAILLRSVKGSAEAITKALDAADIDYVIVGMNSLFSTTEAEAARQLFYFMAGRAGVDRATLQQAWLKAALGVRPEMLAGAIESVARAREQLQEGDEQRWALYSLQRQFLTFLEDAGVREENVPNARGQTKFYNLGKFSQLISDFEEIHFKSNPQSKYEAFAGFLEYGADGAYSEGWQDNHYGNTDAVRIMTVHQAKGMQWPVVFVPALLKNRFPARRPGGLSVWHLVPREAVVGQARFDGTIEDERRLFYVAMTRSQKFLFMTYGLVQGHRWYQQPSEFWHDVLGSKCVKRRSTDYTQRKRLPPRQKISLANIVLSFSDLKYFFECPYQFKLRILYGFNAPIHEALGYGQSLHNALAEVHSRAIRGDIAGEDEAPRLVATHLHVPYAYKTLREQLEKSAEAVVRSYIRDNAERLRQIEFCEKTVDVHLGDGVSVVGRIDLVRRIDSGETTIVDLKSTDRAQPEQVTETQLHIYALGYQELTGRSADYVEIYNLGDRKRRPRAVDQDFIENVKASVVDAAAALRETRLPKQPEPRKCAACDYKRMCSEGCKVERRSA